MGVLLLLLLPLSLGWKTFAWLSPLVLAVILLGYFVPHVLVCTLFRGRDLKKAYAAEWALVTGASSGDSCTSFCKPGNTTARLTKT